MMKPCRIKKFTILLFAHKLIHGRGTPVDEAIIKKTDHVKGTGTRDYNYVKVIWFDRPWLGESPADIHNFFNCPFNLY